jgi:hypothetical protein
MGLRFKKSSRSENMGGCVEVAIAGRGAAVRDSKDRTGPVLHFEDAVLRPLIGRIKAGGLDLPG